MLKPIRWMIIPSMVSFSTLAFAGGVPTELPTGADSSGKMKASTAKASKAAKAKSMAAKRLQRKLPKLQQQNPKRSNKRRQIVKCGHLLVFGL